MKENYSPLVSIITTFFNEEDYLNRSLTSILKQTYQNIEVILIDDGSTDSSAIIAKKYSKELALCKIITTENFGHAEARNTGLLHTTGEYVTFLDADDTFEPTMIEKFTQTMIDNAADLVDGNYTHISEDLKHDNPRRWETSITEIKTTRELVLELYKGNIQPVVWAKMFKTSIAKQIKFDKGLWFDDWPFTLEYLHKASSVSFVEESLFKVYGRKTSITRRTLEPKRIFDTHRILELTTLIHKKYNTFFEFRNWSFKMVLNTYIDNFLIYIIDENRIKNKNLVNKAFAENVNKLKAHVKREDIKISVKERVLLLLLSQSNRIALKVSKKLFILLKENRINKIRQIKQLSL